MNQYSEVRFIQRFHLKPGDRIVVPKSDIRWIQHHALYLGYDDYKNHWISENKFGHGVVLTRVRDFVLENRTVTRIERFNGSGYERKVAVQRALSRLGRPYNLINYNCEHFVNDVLKRRSQSPQVGNAVAVLRLALVVGLLIGGE